MLPTFFISHGSPMMALMDTPARRFLESLAAHTPRPRAILVASAHWETAAPTLNAPARNGTIHDFYGFPPALYALRYPAPGDPALAAEIAAMLTGAGMSCQLDPARGLDHGAWVPLLLAYPQADIPVLQLSLQRHGGPAHHLALGAALRGLREAGVLVIGSGSFTHDLRRAQSGMPDINAPETSDITEFSDWMDRAIRAADFPALLEYRQLAPHAVAEHPSEEHLLPLFVAMGAAGEKPLAERVHSSTEFSFFRMDCYAFS